MQVVSWNVNGLRSAAKKGFGEWLSQTDARIVGLQETRAPRDKVPPPLRQPLGWQVDLVEAERPGYSGVALYSRDVPDELDRSIDSPEHDAEGRLQIARFGAMWLVNAYFPNGSGKERDNSRVPFKIDFYRRLFDRLEPLRAAGERVLVMGDFNTAHRPIDLARPRGNEKTSGFLPEEREELDRWLREGWVDTLRHVRGDEPGLYTWWAQRGDCRARNVGWRIDYVLASPAALAYVRDAFVWADVLGSDHCPVGVELDPAVLRT